MRNKAFFMLFSLVISILTGITLADDTNFKIMKGESIGPIKYGMPSGDVLKILGKPGKKSDIKYIPATGLACQDWDYGKKGIRIAMGAIPKEEQTPTGKFIVLKEEQVGKFSVDFISAKSPCKFATKKGIKIGSTYKETIKAYPPETWSKYSTNDEKSITIGSIYGGMLIEFENSKVKSISIGAYAE